MSKTKSPRRSRYRGVRPFWSGTITFGLVNVPVHLYPGHRSPRLRMRLLAPDGTPLSRRYRCPKHDVDVHPEHLVRGFQLDGDQYVIVSDEDLEAAEPKKSREIELRQFVKLEQVAPEFFERSYFLTPSGDSNKAYRLLAAAMEASGLAGVATFVMRGKEYLVAILAERGILQAATLRFSDELRSPADVGLPEVTAGDKSQVKRFTSAIKELQQNDLAEVDLEDHYLTSLERLVQRKQKAKRDVVKLEEEQAEMETSEETDGVDLLETIRRGLAQKAKSAPHNGSTTDGHRDGHVDNSKSSQLARLSKGELYERAQSLDIEGRSRMTKEELLRAIKNHRQ